MGIDLLKEFREKYNADKVKLLNRRTACLPTCIEEWITEKGIRYKVLYELRIKRIEKIIPGKEDNIREEITYATLLKK